MNAPQNESGELSALIRDMGNLMEATPLQREILDAAIRSVASGMQRVQPSDRAELQSLVVAFMADPGDVETRGRIGAILSRAPKPEY